MAYQITSVDSSKIVLQREATAFASGLFVGVGSLFFIIGVLLNFFMESWAMSDMLFKILSPFFGALAIWAGLNLPRQTKRTIPEQIIFDNAKGLVIIEMVKGRDEVGYIRYNEIEGFDIYIQKETSTSSGRSSTYYTYHVFLKKKDGGEWFLTKSTSRDKADATLLSLRTLISLSANAVEVHPAKLTTKISKQEGIDKTVIHWQNKVSIWSPIFLIIFGAVFLAILSTAFTAFGDGNFFVYGVVGFMIFVFLILMIGLIRKLIKDFTTKYAVAVSKSQFEYYEFSKSSGTLKNQKALPIEEVDRIVYSFDTSKTNTSSVLHVLTNSDVGYLKKRQENPLTALKDIFSGANQPISLSIAALNPVECLQLESWLQELILRKGNIRVL